jgi:hypothetical protein
MSYEHKYKLKYDLSYKAGEFKKEDFEEDGSGGTDALIMFSCIYPEDGSLSTLHWSIDGRTNEPCTDREIFKIWMLLGRKLSESGALDEYRRNLAAFPINTFYEEKMKPLHEVAEKEKAHDDHGKS